MIERKSLFKKLIALGTLIVLFVTLTLLSNNKVVCEFFASTFARAWIYVFGHISSVLPFSCYELFLIVAIVLAVLFVVMLIRFLANRKWNKLLSMVLITAITVLSFLNIYTATATMTYNRSELPQEIYQQQNSETFTYEEAVELAEIMVKCVNEAYLATEHDENDKIVYPDSYDIKELSRLIDEAYAAMGCDYLSDYTPIGKKIINKTIMSELHIVGVFFAPFGEANINGYEESLNLPQTLAHEIAHSKGVMREYEAEIVSLCALLASDDPYLRYSAYSQCFSRAISLLTYFPNWSEKGDYTRLRNMVDKRIYQERSEASLFYSKFNHLDRLGEFFNDLYLKLQKQPDGTGSYSKPSDVVDTGQVDNTGNPIYHVISFSGIDNLLITMYKQSKLK